MRALHLMVICHAGPQQCEKWCAFSWQGGVGEPRSAIKIIVSGSFGLTVIPLALAVYA
jgi:hypothetical protein